ncbi:MAG: M1 family metallopeptidase [Pyrinomonadaceae bacterium]
MKKNIFLVFFVLFAFGVNIYAQQLYMPRNVQRAFKNETRAADGRPGRNYWQNTARYNISISVAPPNRTVTGTEEIVYTNNSPNALDNIVFRLTLNSHAPEAPREREVATDYLTSGFHIDEYTENGKAKAWQERNGSTWQSVKLDEKLAPHGSIKFSFKWHYDVSVKSGREGAIDPTTFYIAYFYPRVAVYDDVDGWDRQNFTEGHEFYNDFNDYTFEVNAPKNYVVWATGDLLNADETLQPEFAGRLKKSFTSDDVVHVATIDELNGNKVTAQKDTVTWKWKADNVTDVALAVSNHYIWDGGSVVVDKATNRRASVQAAYNIEAKDFEKMVEYGKHTLDWASNNFPGVPYPYQKTTVVRGFADMEYPMMVNDNSQKEGNFARFVVEHEILHTWFPFYMGINERRYGFMDEGWATTFENLISRNDLGDEAANNLFKQFRVAGWIKNATADGDIPIITPGDALTGRGFGNNEYGKAALGYLATKDLLGDAEFKKSLHEFIDRWHGKHPLPWDMFNSFNSASGRDLNWFFNNWFFSNGYIDLAVQDVTPTANGYNLIIKNIGGFDAPVNVVVGYDDGTTETLHQTPEIWSQNQEEATVNITTKKKINSLNLDGGIFMDADETNNKWEKK